MSNGNFTPMKRGNSRLFLIEGRARGDHEPIYQGCIVPEGIDWGLGDITKIECPSDTDYGRFEEVGHYRGASDRPSTSVVGRYAADIASELLRLARIGCASDVHIHIGVCEVPTNFNDFQKSIVFENALWTSWGTGELGSLASGDESEVDETSGLSAREVYEILRLAFSEVAGTIITNELIDVVFCDNISCGECEDYSPGCERVYAVSLAEGGSPGSPADVIFTLDGGASWNSSEIDSLGGAEDPEGIACVSGYVVVVSADSCSLHYVLQSDLDAVGDETWLENATGFVDIGTGTCPLDIWSVGNYAFISAEGGYVYGVGDPTAGVTVLEDGSATTNALHAIHAMNRNVCVAVGSSGAVLRTLNGGDTWQVMSQPVGLGVDLFCVWVKTETEWWVGSDDGRLFYTLDGGDTWTEQAFPGSGTGIVWDIAFSSDNVMAISHETALNVGRLLRSYNGGYNFVVLPEGPGALPVSGRFTAIALCENDVNVMAAVGLGGGTDGIALWGED